MCTNSSLTIGHGPALDAGAEGSPAFAGECLHPDVVGGVRIEALDSHVGVAGAVGAVLLTVDVPVHHQVVCDLAVPFGQQWRLPRQLGAGLGQSSDLQVFGEARWYIFRCAYLLYVGLTNAVVVASAEAEDVGGAFMQSGDSVVVIRLFKLARCVGFLVGALVLQLVARQLTYHFLRWLPLNQCCVTHGGADQHRGLAWN